MDVKTVNLLVVCLAIGTLLMLVPLMISAAVVELLSSTVAVAIVLTLLWLGLSRGVYITIDENKNLYGSILFLRGNTTPLSDAVAIGTRKTFAGSQTRIEITFRNVDGILETRGVATQEFLKQGDLKKLIEAISSANPRIEIPKKLLVQIAASTE